jgi:isocitrate/isopropylmalate dehydrogenase
MKAVEAVTARHIQTPDLGGEATTDIVTQAVCDTL